jgi:membrane protein DedA with SNARE-associated domain
MRFVGHLLPEELFMIAIGVVAHRADSPADATVLLGAVFVGHLIGDHTMFAVGVWLERRTQAFPRLAARVRPLAARLRSRPSRLLGLIPGRVFPFARGAWMAACGYVNVPLWLYTTVDALAIVVHIAFWSGLGWFFAGHVSSLEVLVEAAPVVAAWIVATLLTAIGSVVVWRRKAPGRLKEWAPESWRALRISCRLS